MKCKKLVCGCMVFMLIFGMCACGKKEKAKEAAPDLVLELPKEKENSASDSEETVSGMDEATQNEDIPEKKGILIAIDPGHQAPDVDMSAKEPNAPGSNVMKAKATGGTSGRYSGIAEYELNLAISLMLREALQNEGYDVIMTREDNETAISNAERATEHPVPPPASSGRNAHSHARNFGVTSVSHSWYRRHRDRSWVMHRAGKRAQAAAEWFGGYPRF